MDRLLPLILVSVTLVLIPATASAQSVELDPPRVYEGDVTRLKIAHESDIPSLYAIDTSDLAQNFEVLRLDSRVSRITDRQTAGSRMEWTLELAPKRTGRIEIPPLRLGENLTPRVTLQVDPISPAKKLRPDVFMRLEADPPNPYPGQQTRISMALYHAAPLIGGRWREPETDAGRVLHSGYETTDRITIDGVVYRRTTRSLALFPATVGSLVTSPAAIFGDLGVSAANDPDGLYPRGQVRRLYRRSEPLEIDVRALPADHDSDYWLPAFELSLSQQWDDGDRQLAAGDSLQRTITIEARGLPADDLPADLLLDLSSTSRVFPDQPIRGNRFEADILVGRLRQSFAVLLTQTGTVELPPVELAWWDLDADRARVARLPGRVIQVAASGDPTLDGVASTGRAFAGQVAGSPPGPLQKSLLIAFIVGLYLGWIGFGQQLQLRWQQAHRRWQVRRQLQQACEGNDARAARAALLTWARQYWPGQPTYGLAQVGERLQDPLLAMELARLDAAIYRPDAIGWRGRGLWQALQAAPGRRRQPERTAEGALAGLYPGLNR